MDVERLEFMAIDDTCKRDNEIKYVITPDFFGKFRIHKSDLNNSSVCVWPGCANEIMIK